MRFPLLRPFGARTGMCGPVPIEIAFFVDGSVAWADSQRPSFFGGERELISSTGVSLRFEHVEFAVVQTGLAYPFQRPGRGWVWAFNLMPEF